jgi:hypothetical protein
MNLIIGTNMDSNGKFNVEDIKLAGFNNKNITWEDASKKARIISYERITNNPVKYFKWAYSDKLESLWGNESSIFYTWVIGNSPNKEMLKKTVMQSFLIKLIDKYYVISLFLFTIGFFYVYFVKKPYIGIVSVILFSFIIIHTFVEVQPRYHIILLPIIIIGKVFFIDLILNDSKKIKRNG